MRTETDKETPKKAYEQRPFLTFFTNFLRLLSLYSLQKKREKESSQRDEQRKTARRMCWNEIFKCSFSFFFLFFYSFFILSRFTQDQEPNTMQQHNKEDSKRGNLSEIKDFSDICIPQCKFKHYFSSREEFNIIIMLILCVYVWGCPIPVYGYSLIEVHWYIEPF